MLRVIQRGSFHVFAGEMNPREAVLDAGRIHYTPRDRWARRQVAGERIERTMSSEFEGPPKSWPPLGLPLGSVRALLTLIVLAVVVTRLARGLTVDVLWIQTLLIALAHYFTSRRFVSLPPDVMARLEQEGIVERERHPLFLPKNSIRTLIVVVFLGLAVYLYQQRAEFNAAHHGALTQAISLLGIVTAYLLGATARTLGGWWNRRRETPPSGTWGDIKAMTVLVVLALAAIPEFLDHAIGLPPVFHQIALGLMLFYYGSR